MNINVKQKHIDQNLLLLHPKTEKNDQTISTKEGKQNLHDQIDAI